MRLIDADHFASRVGAANPSMHPNAASMKTAVLRGIENSPTVCCGTCRHSEKIRGHLICSHSWVESQDFSVAHNFSPPDGYGCSLWGC